MTDDILKLIEYRFSQAEETMTTESGRHLREAFELRQKCDYREFVEIEKEQTEEVVKNAEKFINEARRVLDKMMNDR